jgi:hypothetical protein
MLRHHPRAEQFEQPSHPTRLSRRAWIAGAVLGIGGVRVHPLLARTPSGQGDGNDADEIAKVKASAAKVGLTFLSQSQTKHFLCMGDAPEVHCREALNICESLADVFLPHFRTRGFKVELPTRHMTVIALKDKASYHAYYGEDPGDTTGGHYDLDTNRLVVFDFRPEREDLVANAPRINLLTLVHETTHQLTYNTGILNQAADVPTCISEGFATYAEMWVPTAKGSRVKTKGSLGTANRPRLQAYINSRQAGEPWIPLAELLANDEVFENPKTEQLANAEAWLLVHYLLKSRLAKFQAYLTKVALTKVAQDGGKTKRVDLAEKELGSLKELDRVVKRYAELVR